MIRTAGILLLFISAPLVVSGLAASFRKDLNAARGSAEVSGSDHGDRDVDVAACGVGVRAHLVRGLHEGLRRLVVHARETHEGHDSLLVKVDVP